MASERQSQLLGERGSAMVVGRELRGQEAGGGAMGCLVRLGQATPTRSLVGGKAMNLMTLDAHGFQIPEAVFIPVGAFDAHVGLAGADDLAGAICSRPLEPGLLGDLRAFIEEVGGRVSVRSSATSEDGREHSFAGQFLTVLNVGSSGVEDAVRRVWASAFAEHVNAYQERASLDAEALKMGVVVQRQLDSDSSGVVMGDGSRAVVEASLGQGEALVSGEVCADHWDLHRGQVFSQTIAKKEWRRGLPPGPPTNELSRIRLSEAQQKAASLSEAQVQQVAALCGRICEVFGGRPQDCEFAFVGEQLYVLQARDLTTPLPVQAPPLGPWEPPGKGAWELDAGHFRRPVTQLFIEQFPTAIEKGFRSCTARYGALLSHVDLAPVNRIMYLRMRPVAAPEDASAKAPPPRFIFKLLCWLVPEMRKRIKQAQKTWETQEWRKQLEEWQQDKQRAIQAHLQLQRVDLVALDDSALYAHFEEVYRHVGAMIEQHHTYNMATMIPVGDYLAQASHWSEGRLSELELLRLLTGISQISADLRSPDAVRVAEVVGRSATAQGLLRLEQEAPVLTEQEAQRALQQLRSLEGETGRSIDLFLERREFRLAEGLDPSAPCFYELPILLWQTLRKAAQFTQSEQSGLRASEPQELEACKARIPASHHQAFDQVLAEARLVYSLRDERAMYSDLWAWGILRTVVLELGRRVLQREPGRLFEREDIIQASASELREMLFSSGGPSAQELNARSLFQRAYTVDDAPAFVGAPPKPPPPSEMLPPHAARVTDAVMSCLGLILSPSLEAPEMGASEWKGRAASNGVYEGRVHVVRSAQDIKAVEKDSVLVVGSSSSAFTMLAPLASAVISEGGGLLSHVSIVCREYGIPCVCGLTDVAERLQTGDLVRVDGTQGKVFLLESTRPELPDKPKTTSGLGLLRSSAA